MNPIVVFARTEPEREAICELRYRVGARENSLPERGAGHQVGSLTDAFDPGAHLIAAWDAGQVVGTLRINLPPLGDQAEAEGLSDLRALAGEPSLPVAVSSRFVIAQEYRHTRLAFMIVRTAVDFLRRRGIGLDVLLARRSLEPSISALGYRTVGGPLRHALLGEVLPMRLDLRDRLQLIRLFQSSGGFARAALPPVGTLPGRD